MLRTLTLDYSWAKLLQEFLNHATPDYLVRGTDLFSLRLPNKKMTTVDAAIAVLCEWIKITPIFFQISKKYSVFFGVPQNFSNKYMCAMRWKRWKMLLCGTGCLPSWLCSWWGAVSLESILPYIASAGKDLNYRFKVQVLLNGCHFCTVIMSKYSKSNHPKLGTVHI